MRIITIDTETQNIFQDVGSNDPTSLDISVVCIHDSGAPAGQEFKSFVVNDLKGLWPILESADGLVTWNGEHFDIPLLNKYYPGDLTKIKSIDLMKEIQLVLGRRLKLDSVASATLGTSKSGHGLEAVEWWKKGEVDKIITYCTDDVKLTRELFDFAVKNGHLKFKDISGGIRQIKLNTAPWMQRNESALTFTLPF
ncbi:MAG TPA: ribonuclease H-like domain-containing protein [Candidatus Paceibacterota bacterium]